MHMQLHADDGRARDPGGSPFACESGCARPCERRAVGARQTSSVVQHRQRGRSRRRSGSRRAPAARAAVDCSFAPGAVTSAARIASLDHAWSGSVGGVAAMATEQQSWSSRRAWPFRLGHVESALDRASCNSRVGVVVTGGGSAPLPQRRWGRDVDAQERIVPEPMASPGQDRP